MRALDAEVLAVSVDTKEANRRLAESAGLEFSLLSDREAVAVDAFGLRHPGGSMDGSDIARPGVFIVGRDGKISLARLDRQLARPCAPRNNH